MLSAFLNIFKIPDLRKRVILTLLLLIACRIGTHIPTPGVNAVLLQQVVEKQGGIFGLLTMFSGGAFSKASVFALGIMPYISASIILQLLTAVVPSLERLAKEGGEEGRKKITQYTRYGTVLLCLVQGFMMTKMIESWNMRDPGIVLDPGMGFRLMAMITFTTGTIFLMWVGEQITQRGIGNGISLIITINIISRLPFALMTTWANLSLLDPSKQTLKPEMLVILLLLFIFVVASIILITQGQRKIPVQYAKRVVGRRVYTGQSSYIPLRINYAGVIPVIFASALLSFPQTFRNAPILSVLATWFTPGTWVYLLFFVLLIIFFTYFWTATQFDPVKMANDMKKNGAFVPGIRPGKPTATFFEKTMNRLTISGALFLAFVAVLPQIISGNIKGVDYNMASFYGGTGLLIIVGVMLDTMRTIESHLLMRHYDGFLKKGKLRGRY